MTNTTQTKSKMLEALVQNYGFKKAEYAKLPTIDFVYPDFTADGNTESFRFSQSLRAELRSRANIVRENLAGKNLAWTLEEPIMLEVGKVAPRLGIEDQITGKINSIYSYNPLLFTGEYGNEFAAYVVKPVVDASMAWFELTKEEQTELKEILEKKAQMRPYKNLFQKLFSRETK